MTTTLFVPPSRTRVSHTTVILPYLPENAAPDDHALYMHFIRALREGPSRRMEVRILTAIHRTADATDNSDAYVSRVLADMGLMAPRLAFPGDFLDHVDATLIRNRPLRSVPAAYMALAHHWAAIGEDLYALSDSFKSPDERLYSFLTTA